MMDSFHNSCNSNSNSNSFSSNNNNNNAISDLLLPLLTVKKDEKTDASITSFFCSFCSSFFQCCKKNGL